MGDVHVIETPTATRRPWTFGITTAEGLYCPTPPTATLEAPVKSLDLYGPLKFCPAHEPGKFRVSFERGVDDNEDNVCPFVDVVYTMEGLSLANDGSMYNNVVSPVV